MSILVICMLSLGGINPKGMIPFVLCISWCSFDNLAQVSKRDLVQGKGEKGKGRRRLLNVLPQPAGQKGFPPFYLFVSLYLLPTILVFES